LVYLCRMESFGYKPSAQSDEPTQAQPETRREDLTQHAPSPREALPKQFRGYKVLKRMTGATGEAQTFLGKKETGDMFSIFITLAKRRKRTGRKMPYKNGLNTP